MKKLHAGVVVAIGIAIAVAVMVGGRARSAEFQPTRISMHVTGQGPDVILIPGLASGRRVWDGEVARLKDHYRLHLVQVLGFDGEPAGPNASGPVLQPVIDDVHAYMVANHLTSAPVIGHSMGGLVGLRIAEQYPDDLKRLLIVDSLPFFGVVFGGPNATVEAMTPIAKSFSDRIIQGTQEAYAAGQDAQLARLVKSPQGRVLALAQAQASDHAVVGQALYDDLTTDARPDLAKIKAHVVVLYPWDESTGAPQAAFDQMYQGAYAPLADKAVTRIDGSYHFIMYDQPEAMDREIQAFLVR